MWISEAFIHIFNGNNLKFFVKSIYRNLKNPIIKVMPGMVARILYKGTHYLKILGLNMVK